MTALYVASNSTALGSQIQMQRNVANLGDVLSRLSTGLRINSGKDDPAGLIASELLKSDITATKQAIQNTQRANSVIAIADSALGQVSSLLNDVRQLVNASANEISMTPDQLTANQLQVDASIESIDRIAKTTNFQGQKLLDGSMGFQTSGVGNSEVSNVTISQANFGSAADMAVKVDLIEAAKKGTLIYNGSKVDEQTVLNIRGSEGSQTVSIGAGSDVATMAAAINQYADSTGVEAFVEGQASRGSITLSSAGANNEIVVTAKETGYDNGNYTFRIVEGERNDAYIVSDPTANKSGIVEISLERAYTKTYEGFVDAFDVTFAVDGASADTSISITRGTKNEAYLATEDQVAAGRTYGTSNSVEVTVQNAGTGGHMSNLNGWTFQMVDAGYEFANKMDMDSKTAYFTDKTNLDFLVGTISGATNAHGGANMGAEVTAMGISVALTGTLAAGDKFTLANGAEAGELVVTYKEGATNQDIVDMINKNSGVTATLKSGVDGSALMKDIPGSPTRASSDQAVTSSLTSSATANDVIRLINTKLGDMFEATTMTGQSGSGFVTFQDAGAIYGSVESDNALRFTGADNGPVVRLTAADPNQKLGVTLRNPTSDDIKMGITQQVLEIQLATDASGNSTTTAADIVALFDSLTAEQTGGVSASLVLPAGVDINGRTWTTDNCNNETVSTDCNATYGKGICGPTGTSGECGIEESDIILLGANEKVVETNAVGYVQNSTSIATTAADTSSGFGSTYTDNGAKLSITAANTSVLNGVTINFLDGGSAGNAAVVNGFDATTGVLTMTLATSGNNAAVATDIGTVLSTYLTTAANCLALSNYNGSAQGNNAAAANTVSSASLGTFSAADLVGNSVTINGGSQATDVKGSIASTGAVGIPTMNANTTATIRTDKATSALNGVSFNFTSDASKAGFNSENGALTVYLNTATQGIAAGVANQGRINQEVEQAINGAINDQWEQIRQYTGSTEGPVTVSFNLAIDTTNNAAFSAGTLIANLGPDGANNTLLKIPGNAASTVTSARRGVSVDDAALKITSKTAGTDMAGTTIQFVQKDDMQKSTLTEAFVTTEYDEKNKVLTVYANSSVLQTGTEGGINAALLATALNKDATFTKNFKADAPIVNSAPTAATSADTLATVAFTSNALAQQNKTTMVGGWDIETGTNDGVAKTGVSSSSGISMLNNSDSNERLVLRATEAGANSYVSVDVIQGKFTTVCPLGAEMSYLAGTDAVVNVNGQRANANGNNVEVSTSSLQANFTIDGNMASGTSTNFNIDGGGSVIQLGADVVSSQQVRIGIPDISSATLGGASGKLFQLKTGGIADLKTDTKLADKIVQEAITSVTMTRGRLGTVQKSTLEPNQAVLEDTMEQLSSAEAIISNADFAEESAALTQAQILVQSGQTVLSLANQFPQYAAALIR